MQQIALEQPGRFRADTVEPPQAAPGEALVRVHRIGVCGTDLHAYTGNQPFFDFPRILGHELGVEVMAVNGDADGIEVGDHCCVAPGLACGHCVACEAGKTNCCESLQVIGVHADGGMREFFTLPIANLHRSDSLTLDQLALVETLTIGAHAVERGAPTAGDRVLVVGAGPIGLTVMQFLMVAGAAPVVMDIRSERLAFCREQLGVTGTVQADADALEHLLRDQFGGELPDLIIDATGFAPSMNRTFELAAHGARIVFVGVCRGDVTFDDPNFHRRELTLLASRNSTAATFRSVIAAVESGQVDTRPWITHRLGLGDVPTQFGDLPDTAGLIKAVVEV
jgi:2-desacetyl-2-hydroxyethyl bacteriochlorophyllide A dehydrogenase